MPVSKTTSASGPREFFRRFARRSSELLGTTESFFADLAVILVWTPSARFFGTQHQHDHLGHDLLVLRPLLYVARYACGHPGCRHSHLYRGLECDACEKTISNAPFIVEGISTMTNQGLQLHVECFDLWDVERHEAARGPQGRPWRHRALGGDAGRRLAGYGLWPS
jgi:hypothetical protein